MYTRFGGTLERLFVSVCVVLLFVSPPGIPSLIQTAIVSLVLFVHRPDLFRRHGQADRSLVSIVLTAVILVLIGFWEAPALDAIHWLVGGWILDVRVLRAVAGIFALIIWFARDEEVLKLLVHSAAIGLLTVQGLIWLSPVSGSINTPAMVIKYSSPVLVGKMWKDLPKAAPFDVLRKVGTPGNPSGIEVTFNNLRDLTRGKDPEATARIIAPPIVGGLPFAWFFSGQVGMMVGCLAGAGSWLRQIPRVPIVWAWIGFTLAWLIHVTSVGSAILGSLAAMFASPLTIGLNNVTGGRFLDPAFADLTRGFLSGAAIGFLLLAAWALAKRRFRSEGRHHHKWAGIALTLAALLWVGLYQTMFGGGLAPATTGSRLLFAVYQCVSGVIVFYMGHSKNALNWIIGICAFVVALLFFSATGALGAAIGIVAIIFLTGFFFSAHSRVFPAEWGRGATTPHLEQHHDYDDNGQDELPAEEEPDPRVESLKLLANRLVSVAIPSVIVLLLQGPLVLSATTTAVPPVSVFPMSVSPIAVVERALTAPALQGGRLVEADGGNKLVLCADTPQMLSSMENAQTRTGEVCGQPVAVKRVKAGNFDFIDRLATADLPEAKVGDPRLKYTQPVITQTNLTIFLATALAVIATVGPNDEMIRMILSLILGSFFPRSFAPDLREVKSVFRGPRAIGHDLPSEVLLHGRYLFGFMLTIISWVGIDLLWSMLARVEGMAYFGLETWMVKAKGQFGGLPHGFPTIPLGDLRDGVMQQSIVGEALTNLSTLGWKDGISVMPVDLVLSKLGSSWMMKAGSWLFLETGANFFVFLFLSFLMTLMINLLAEMIILGAPRVETVEDPDGGTTTIIQ